MSNDDPNTKSRSNPGFDEWRDFLTKEMKVLDKAWEDDLDDVWTYTPNALQRTVHAIADDFYHAYWKMFRGVLQENKSWEEMKQAAGTAAEEAYDHVAKAWLTVVNHKLNRAEEELSLLAKDPKTALIKPKQLFREAGEAKRRAYKHHTTHGRYQDAIEHYREAVQLIIHCEGEMEEIKRKVAVSLEDQQRAEKREDLTFRLTKTRVLVGIIALLVTIFGLVYRILSGSWI